MKRVLLFTAIFLLTQNLSAQQKIWLDTDIMFSKWAKDVDDGLALIAVLNSPEIELEGISLTQDVQHGFRVTQKILSGNGKVVPVYKGARDFSELGKGNEAVAAMADALRKENLTVLSLGPATNIATLLMLHPELESRIDEIVFCMGRTPGARFNPGSDKKNLSDYNFDLDVKAMEVILKTKIRLSFSGYEAAAFIHFKKEDYQSLREGGSYGKWVFRQLRSWERLWKIYLGSKNGFIPFDLATLGYLITPHFFKCEKEIAVKIREMENDTRFQNKNDTKPYLLVSHQFDAERKAVFCNEALADYQKFILKRICAVQTGN